MRREAVGKEWNDIQLCQLDISKELEYKMLRKMYLELEDERDSLLDKIKDKNKALNLLCEASTYFEEKLKKARKKIKMYEA